MSVPVFTTNSSWAAAIAELPLSAHRFAEPAGSIVVLAGGVGWGVRVGNAREHGAAAVIVCDPRPATADEIDSAGGATQSALVVIERSLLRPDIVADARANAIDSPSLIHVECSGPSSGFETVVGDAVGWARILAGGSLEFVSGTVTPRGVCALFERPAEKAGDRPLPVTVLASKRAATRSWIRAAAIGADRIEVTIDDARQLRVVERTSLAGRSSPPTRWESAERVVLRRAIELTSTGSGSQDLAELQHDWTLAQRALTA